MNHPILYSWRASLIYLLAWILVMGVHVMILSAFYTIPVTSAIADAVVYDFLFAAFALSIWYVVRYNQPQKSRVFNLFVSHVSSVVIVLLLWLGIASLLQNIVGVNEAYRNFSTMALPWRIISGLFFYFIVILVYYLMIYYHDLQEKVTNEIMLQTKVKEAELNLLKSQINPHFLFNSLNSVSSLILTNPPQAHTMIIQLSDFLRYNVSRHELDFVPLQHEIEHVKKYLAIEQVRFGDRLMCNWDIDEVCLAQKVPAMILQPLYENAVKHGVYESTQTITIRTSIKQLDGLTEIRIHNNIDPEAIPKKGSGLGLKNIADRLRLYYQTEGMLQIRKEDYAFEVILRIPELIKS